MSSQSNRIKQRRIQLGMSQEDLAFQVGTSQKQISRYERGMNDPTGDVLSKLASSLNTTTDYILGNSDNPTREVIKNDLDDVETEIIQLLRDQPNQMKKQALNVIKAMLIPDAS